MGDKCRFSHTSSLHNGLLRKEQNRYSVRAIFFWDSLLYDEWSFVGFIAVMNLSIVLSIYRKNLRYDIDDYWNSPFKVLTVMQSNGLYAAIFVYASLSLLSLYFPK